MGLSSVKKAAALRTALPLLEALSVDRFGHPVLQYDTKERVVNAVLLRASTQSSIGVNVSGDVQVMKSGMVCVGFCGV